jgi:hypothetical protein
MTDQVEDFLEHYGIKGMRWGVRNEESEAKVQATQAKRNQKAKKYEDRAGKAQAEIQRLNQKTPRTALGRNSVANRKAELEAQKARALDDARRKREGKLSKGQKTTAIGAGVVAAALIAYGGYSLAQSGEAHRLSLNGKQWLSERMTGDFAAKSKSPWAYNPNLAKRNASAQELQEIASKINPGYGKPGTSVNCRRCTFAYEMRRRGYDVAATKTTNGRGQGQTSLYNAINQTGDRARSGRSSTLSRYVYEKVQKPDSEFVKMIEDNTTAWKNAIDIPEHGSAGAPTQIYKALARNPNGARGELTMMWRGGGGGHSVAWEIVDGKPVVFDTQLGKRFNDPMEFSKQYKSMVGKAGYTRLDDMKLNEEFLKRWLRHAK